MMKYAEDKITRETWHDQDWVVRSYITFRNFFLGGVMTSVLLANKSQSKTGG